MCDRPQRSVATIAAELAELTRHLREMPPHHGGGQRELQDRLRRLERELAAARRASDAQR